MKSRILILSLFTVALMASCQKSAVTPDFTSTTPPATTNPTTPATPTSSADTVINVTGYISLKLGIDAFSADGTLIYFDPKSKTTYVKNEDAAYFGGQGVGSLSSLSSDGIQLAINTLPLSKKNLKIALDMTAKTDGTYKINMAASKFTPANFDVFLVDTYKKDSLNLQNSAIYSFGVQLADTASFGKKRFLISIHQK